MMDAFISKEGQAQLFHKKKYKNALFSQYSTVEIMRFLHYV